MKNEDGLHVFENGGQDRTPHPTATPPRINSGVGPPSLKPQAGDGFHDRSIEGQLHSVGPGTIDLRGDQRNQTNALEIA